MITSGCVTHHKSAALRLGTQTEYSEELDSLSKARRFEVQLFSCIFRIRFSTLMSEIIGVSRNLGYPGLSLEFPGCVENGLFSCLCEMPSLKACGRQKPQNLNKKQDGNRAGSCLSSSSLPQEAAAALLISADFQQGSVPPHFPVARADGETAMQSCIKSRCSFSYRF